MTNRPERPDPTFRDRVRDRLTEAFGPPQELKAEAGFLYRWVLPRERGVNTHVYLTLDSPELPMLAHVLVSDPGAEAVEPISSITMRTMEEVERFIERVRSQVKR